MGDMEPALALFIRRHGLVAVVPSSASKEKEGASSFLKENFVEPFTPARDALLDGLETCGRRVPLRRAGDHESMTSVRRSLRFNAGRGMDV